VHIIKYDFIVPHPYQHFLAVWPITAVHSLRRITGQYQVVAIKIQDNSKIPATCPCNRKLTILFSWI